MEGEPEVAVVRLGHRPGRDDRMTTHVALTTRALGADRVVLPTNAGDAVTTAEDVTTRFGGPFTIETAESPRAIIREWENAIVHLTMYGEPIQSIIDPIHEAHETTPILVVVGAEKVPFDVYEWADWNVAITNQPHSEVAGLAVFLDHLYDGRELDRNWGDADQRVVPNQAGKQLEDIE